MVTLSLIRKGGLEKSSFSLRLFATLPSKGPPSSYFPPAEKSANSWLTHQRIAISKSSQSWKNYGQRAELEAFLDFRFAGDWFPGARLMGSRKIFCHVGPTNSGKTHAAMQKLLTSERAVYCAPLRLLAMEMWERVNREGKRCGLRTGEFSSGPVNEPDCSFKDAPILACTTEMLDLEREWDVAVIDEIQLLADEQRAWAFTQALLGLKAKEIYLCGEEATIPLIEKIITSLGEQAIITKYQRLSPLCVSENSLNGDLSKLRSGDCIVSFGRNSIFELKEQIESRINKKCAVVYGSLPMENRIVQAKKFNERTDGYEVMVASDAVGMGLNLNIQRIIFSEVKKSSAKGIEFIHPSRIKQIAGRAGRYGFGTGSTTKGEVTCLSEKDLKYVKKCMSTPNEEYDNAGIQPPTSKLEELCTQFPDLSLSMAMSATMKLGKFDQHFFPCLGKEMQLLAFSLQEFPKISITDRMTLACAPVNLKCPFNINTFRRLVDHIDRQQECKLEFDMKQFPNPQASLGVAESLYKSLDLYLWLSTRFPLIFTDRETVLEKRAELSKNITGLLAKITRDGMTVQDDDRHHLPATDKHNSKGFSSLGTLDALDRIINNRRS